MPEPVKEQEQTQDNPIPTDQQNQSPPQPQTGPTDVEQLRTAFLAAMAEKTAETERLKAELVTARAPVAPSNTDPWQDFTTDPAARIQQEVAKAVAPLNLYVQELRKKDTITALKQQVRAIDKSLARVLDKAEAYVDNILQGQAELDLNKAVGACNLVAGMIATNKLPGLSAADLSDSPVPTPTPTPTPKTIPAQLSPSSSPLPNNTDTKSEPWKDLTENERRLARVNGMTDEAYYKAMHQESFVVSDKKGSK